MCLNWRQAQRTQGVRREKNTRRTPQEFFLLLRFLQFCSSLVSTSCGETCSGTMQPWGFSMPQIFWWFLYSNQCCCPLLLAMPATSEGGPLPEHFCGKKGVFLTL